jgi:DNA-binding NarL/FixJ family response regulator
LQAFKLSTPKSADPSHRTTWRLDPADEGRNALAKKVADRGEMGRGAVVEITDRFHRAPSNPRAHHLNAVLGSRLSWNGLPQAQNRPLSDDVATSVLVATLKQALAAFTNKAATPSNETMFGEQRGPLQTLTLIQALLTASVDGQSRQLVDLMGQVLASMRDRHETAARSLEDLTARQRQIMNLVLAGHPSKNIAADLAISQRTVENHRAAIMRKTGVKSLPELARLEMHCL